VHSKEMRNRFAENAPLPLEKIGDIGEIQSCRRLPRTHGWARR
jgi:hypothetical protein